MARLIALEWDDAEVRVVVANRRNANLLVEHAFVTQLTTPAPPQPAGAPAQDVVTDSRGMAVVKLPTPEEIGQAITESLKSRGIARGECLVAVGRTNIELKHLQLPPSPDDELPDMVRFQALRDFNKLQEDSPLDYIPLSGDDNEPRYVLAAAMAPELVDEMFVTCSTAGLLPKRFVLRPCAAASLLRRARPDEIQQVCLLVDLLADETDLTVQVDGVEVFMRTARVTGDSAAPGGWRSLLVEIRRTMAAVSNQLGGRRVEAIYLCGDGQRHTALAKQIEQELQLPAHLLDPFSVVELSPALAAALPEHHGRYAPLLGMLADEAAGTAPSIDFLHPRQRPEPPSHKRTWIAVGAAAVVAVLCVLYYGYSQIQQKEAAVAQLNAKLKTIELSMAPPGTTPKADGKDTLEKKAEDIDRWASGDRVWIDELKQLSDKFAKSQDAMLTSLSASVGLQSSDATLEGAARNKTVVDEIATAVRDGGHKVENKDVRPDPRIKNYPWHFTTKIGVTKPVRPAATSPLKKPATDVAADGVKGKSDSSPAVATAATTRDSKQTPAKDGKETAAPKDAKDTAPTKEAKDKPADAKSPPADAKAPAADVKTPPSDTKSPPAETSKPTATGKGA